MGGLFKKKSSKSTTSEKSENRNLLANDKNFMNTFTAANAELANGPLFQYQMADYSEQFKQAQANLLQGIDQSDLEASQQYLGGIGQSQLTQGLQGQSQAQGMLSRLANMTQEDYQKGYQSEYNSDLVREQIAQATQDINQQRDEAIFNLNQGATSSGNMGSSRSGIAQGVIVGKAAQAVGSASVQYRTAEEQLAQQRYQAFLGLQQSAAGNLASFASNQMNFGLSAYNQSVAYGQQRNANTLQQWQNSYNVGLQQQAMQQQQLEMQRQNQMMMANPALARLQQYGAIVQPFANNGTTGNTTTTTITPAKGNGMMGGILGAAGAVVGGIYGGPMGAKLGAGLGGSIGQSM